MAPAGGEGRISAMPRPLSGSLSNDLATFAVGGRMFITGPQEAGRDGRGQHVVVSIRRCLTPLPEATTRSHTRLWLRRGTNRARCTGIHPRSSMAWKRAMGAEPGNAPRVST